MKREQLVVACVAIALVAIGATPALAAGRKCDAVRGCGQALVQYCNNAVRGYCGWDAGMVTSWVDIDGSGVCDNALAGTRTNWVDADGDGVCDNLSGGCGTGWIDENGNGVCDNAGTSKGCGGRMENEQGKNAQGGYGKCQGAARYVP